MEEELIVQADARHIPLKDGCVQTVVTSPPYWGLRSYGTADLVWGGEEGCEHEWEGRTKRSGGAYAEGSKKRWQHSADDFERDDRFLDGHPEIPAGCICALCGAWRGSLGLEPTPELYVQHIVQVFREIRRVLREDGTVWANWGDSYAGGRGSSEHHTEKMGIKTASAQALGRKNPTEGLKPKDLVGIPWRVAFALQADGWYLRSDNHLVEA